MFTGIIRAKAGIKKIEKRGENKAVTIALPRGWKLPDGASVAVEGICSTVIRSGRGVFEVEYMPETLRLTTAADFTRGHVVNLEPPLRLGDTLDGHFVQGHVDGVAEVARVGTSGSAHEITIRIPGELQKFIAHKGSITMNGVALTVARTKSGECTVALIPYTLEHTNLGALQKGDRVNIEVDLLARYLASVSRK
jgi:riboflavin synthase